MNSFQPIFAVYVLSAIVLAMVSGCSPDFHKADADKEVYSIIDSKWTRSEPRFGQSDINQKYNYVIADANSISAPNNVSIDKNQVNIELITLAQAVALATKYNRDYQTQKEGLYLTALALTGERYRYALQWFGTVDYEFSKNGDNPHNETVKSEVGASKSILTPQGILLNSSLAIDWVRFLTGDPRTTLSSVLNSTLDIPLLGNGGGKVAWENLTQAERDVLYQIRTFNRYRQTFVVDVISSYYGVLRQRDSVTNAKNNWNRSIESRKQLEMEAKTGRSSPFEVDQARQRELSSYDSYVTTLQNYQQALDLYKVRLTLPVNAPIELDQNELMVLRDVATGEPNVTVDAAIDMAFLCRLDYLHYPCDGLFSVARRVLLQACGLLWRTLVEIHLLR